MMDTQSSSQFIEAPQILPPPPGTFVDREELIQHVGGKLLMSLLLKVSTEEKTGSRLTNYPFETVGKKDDGFWILTIKNGTHNHEPLKDISQHPSARRFTEKVSGY
ncbi:hypothetical protein Patl1_29374 [Pistacia atlantica]|uniref:Uncharacterized protein n=1 Tax=Pistacia atlantica TaxID=434234 RepID=A0ACC1A9W1_9ROSI|nr:hypothetical protein Patl1_29374 [Pistacia atlantica]